MREPLPIELIRQITPMRIELFDQLDFPGTPPALHRMLSRTGFENGIVRLEIDEHVDSVLPREAGNQLGFVLGDAPGQIVGDADIQGAVSLARQDINEKGVSMGAA